MIRMGIIIAVILLFLGIGMLILIHLCMIGRSFFIRRFQNPARFDINNNNNNRAMSEDDVQELPCYYDYKAKDKENSYCFPVLDCAVCLEDFKIGEKCRLLPLCRHSFHADCVDSWLLRNPICPVCRTGAGLGETVLTLGDQTNHYSEEIVEMMENHNMESSHFNDVRTQVRNSTTITITNIEPSYVRRWFSLQE